MNTERFAEIEARGRDAGAALQDAAARRRRPPFDASRRAEHQRLGATDADPVVLPTDESAAVEALAAAGHLGRSGRRLLAPITVAAAIAVVVVVVVGFGSGRDRDSSAPTRGTSPTAPTSSAADGSGVAVMVPGRLPDGFQLVGASDGHGRGSGVTYGPSPEMTGLLVYVTGRDDPHRSADAETVRVGDRTAQYRDLSNRRRSLVVRVHPDLYLVAVTDTLSRAGLVAALRDAQVSESFSVELAAGALPSSWRRLDHVNVPSDLAFGVPVSPSYHGLIYAGRSGGERQIELLWAAGAEASSAWEVKPTLDSVRRTTVQGAPALIGRAAVDGKQQVVIAWTGDTGKAYRLVGYGVSTAELHDVAEGLIPLSARDAAAITSAAADVVESG